MTIRPVHLIERGEVHLLDRRQHRPHKVIRRHPIQQRRRQQQRLLAVARDEVLRHAANFIKRAGRDFSRHPHGEQTSADYSGALLPLVLNESEPTSRDDARSAKRATVSGGC